MRVPLTMPDLGTRSEIVRICGWLVECGETIIAGDRIVEVILPGVTFDVEAAHSGRLVEMTKAVDEQVAAEDILGWIEAPDP